MNATTKNPVGRPREFDEDKVLAAAIDVFWLQGYDSTSMADLLAATGLHKGSLYQAFGDKHTLFIQALQRYVNEFCREMREAVENADDGLEAVRALLLQSMEKGCRGEDNNAGCLVINTLVDMGMEDPEVVAVLAQGYARRIALFVQAVTRAQEEGSLRKDIGPEQMAMMINIMGMGMIASLRGPMDLETSAGLIETFLKTLRTC